MGVQAMYSYKPMNATRCVDGEMTTLKPAASPILILSSYSTVVSGRGTILRIDINISTARTRTRGA
jgi:hypothetical protein